ncbi:DNA polymerase III subunit epsilon [Vibrio inusitatus NBRC 102082]|uniref:DNA-directed DNA polymerase n=1 Tax=Vibrio inusitatus NBRC 102082 TaxID=1219070 RepID=A0A4Y3HYP4_9VIBR|nr:3'-5' exonuclease [Vibrio inusitatus]GEA52111.1 DNA polymerase III subunit epsilon [Vibrio inusitatus NBRC 102082]
MPLSANSVVVLDFETTGLSPNMGDRAIEIGAVKLLNGEVADTFQQLMNPGFRVSSFIERYTGISNNMLRTAPSCAEVMREFASFVGQSNMVAHNASFDKRFLDAELLPLGIEYQGQFACSMLIARRLYQDAPTHKLGDLVRYKNIEHDGVFHRALADSEMTAKLWMVMLQELQTRGVMEPEFAFMQKIAKTSKSALDSLIGKQARLARV